MKNLLSLIFLFTAVVTVPAATINIQLEDCPYPDNERGANAGLTQNWQDTRNCKFVLSVTGYIDTNTYFKTEFGLDVIKTNNILEAEETSVAFAFNAGIWEMRPKGLKECYTAAPVSGTAEEKTLTVTILVDKNTGEPESIEFKDGDTPIVFEGLDLSNGVPYYLRPDTWDTLRVTARGYEDSETAISASFKHDGAAVIIR